MNHSTARAIPPHMLRGQEANPRSSNSKGQSAKSRPASRSPSRRPQQRLGNPTVSTTEALSPDATAALIRRVLCQPSASAGLSSPRHWRDQLPPLTSNHEIDEQLYAIIAVIVRDFVLAWYTKITPDHEFVSEVVEIIAHCTNQLESRARNVDWVEFCGHEIPKLIDEHVKNYEAARRLQNGFVSKQQAYHSFNHHPAFDPAPDPKVPRHSSEKQGRNEAAYRQLLVQGALAALLPREDLSNPTLRYLIADILADMILGNAVSGRLCEGWVVWEVIVKTSLVLQARKQPIRDSSADEDDRENDSDELVDTRSALERSGLLETKLDDVGRARPGGLAFDQTKLPVILWQILVAANYVYLGVTILVSFGRGLYAATSLPSRCPQRDREQDQDFTIKDSTRSPRQPDLPSTTTGRLASLSKDKDGRNFSQVVNSKSDSTAGPISNGSQAPGSTNDGSGEGYRNSGEGATWQKKRPMLMFAGFSMLNRLVGMGERMPWMSGMIALLRHQLVSGAMAGRAGDTDGPLDKYLYYHATSHLSSGILPPILRVLRAAIFPDNALAPPRVVPNSEQQSELKKAATWSIVSLLPRPVLKVYFGSDEQAAKGIDSILDIFSDSYCNKHLIFGIIELLIVRLIPELIILNTGELLSENIGGV